MSCSHPYILYHNHQVNDKTNKKKYLFRAFDYELFIYLQRTKQDFFLVPCGKCIECKLAYRKQWSVRLLNELEYSKNAYFLTLTYNGDNCPKNGTLVKEHLTRFFKSLKEHFSGQSSSEIKYYACGEYGDKLRPHYHAIVFNLPDDDFTNLFPYEGRYIYKKSKTGETLYYSETIEKIWNKGFTDLGKVTFNSCSYVAGYVQKKLYGDDADLYKKANLLAPFMICSKGIGKRYLLDHKKDITKTNEIFYLKKDKVCSSGSPRYYLKLLEKYDADAFNKIKELNKSYTENFINTLSTMSMKEIRDYYVNKKRKSENKDKMLVRE